ncbi:MAG: carbohydrate ABC transporter permease [Candidatus Dormibacteraeota bacterium]|nr:carbohydrate ABC transporter permease [Candidatus Dormibacteraeota bacterium]
MSVGAQPGLGVRGPTAARRRRWLRTARVGERPNIVAGVFGVVWLIIVVAPIWYLILSSFRSQATYEVANPWLPEGPFTLGNFMAVMQQGFTTYLRNSILVTVSAVVLTTGLALLAGYAIVRGQTAFTRVVFRLFLLGLAVPGTAVLIPLFFLVTTVHLFDTFWAIVLPSAAFGLPVSVLVMTNFLRDVPTELFEAMAIDGAGERDLLLHLVLPIARPALVAVAVFNTLGAWNGFVFPLILTSSPAFRVLPLAIYNFEGEYTINVPAILATVLISAVPVVLFYAVGRRYLVRGLVAGYSR